MDRNAKKLKEIGPSSVTDKCKLTLVTGNLMLYTYLLFQIFVGSFIGLSVSVLC